MKKVNMQMIADNLHISKSLVSLALNDKYGVSNEMRTEIFKTAIKLGYDFNYNYKDKNDKNRKRIIVYMKRIEAIENPYWTKLLEGSEKLLSEENMKFSIFLWDNDTKQESFLYDITKSNVQGILIIDEIPDDILEILKGTNIPILFVDARKYLDEEFDNVRTNNYLGGYLACEYLRNMGHTRIAFVGNKDFSISFRERYYGFKNFIDDHNDMEFYGIINQSTYDESKDFKEDSNVIKSLKNKSKPTAIFCANDKIAMFVYDELKRMGLKPYEDISVIGFDDIPESSLLDPPLTSVRVEIKELGKTAVDQLLKRIKHKELPKKSILLSVDINSKQSVRRLN